MGTERKQAPLIAIVGETASGKSALALELAKRYDGEIICADSRTVYKGMDIGTAKPSKEEQAEIPHHLLDIVEPSERFTVADFKSRANQVIDEITARGKLPIMVGGTGLYVDSVLFDYDFSPEDAERNEQNPRHLKEPVQGSRELRPHTLILGMSVPKEELEKRIEQRVEKMIQQGLEDEVMALADRYGWEPPAMSGVGYQEWQAYFAGTQTLAETKQLVIIHTRQYAKRQRTWFKRNKYIYWFADAASALACATNWAIENSSTGQNAIMTSDE